MKHSTADRETDRRLGLLLREAREQAALSLSGLGDRLGVSFQQVSKYEQGIDRLAATAMLTVLKTLDLPADYFFRRLETWDAEPPIPFTKTERELLAAHLRLPRDIRRHLVQFMTAFADGMEAERARSGAAK